MKRRTLGILVAFAWLVGCGGRVGAPTNPILPQTAASFAAPSRDAGAKELPEPPVVHSIHGVAGFALGARLDPASGLPAFEYDHMVGVAPTIDINPGDTFKIALTDNLPHGGMASDVNLHFHGLTVSPRGHADDVLKLLAKPGETLNYAVYVPKNQEPGLYWYHVHVHGQTSYQVGDAGMSGAIIVEGRTPHLPRGQMKQRLIIVRATATGPTGSDVVDSMDGPKPDAIRPQFVNSHPCSFDDGLRVTLNGSYHPTITIAPHEKQLFRVVNATGHKTLRLNVEGEKLDVIAVDGYALDTNPGTPPTIVESSVIIPPAGRADFVVTGPASGQGKFRTLCYNTGPSGDPDPPALLAQLVAPKYRSGNGGFSTHSRVVDQPLPPNVYDTALPPPAAKRTVILSENGKGFFINGKRFAMKDPPMFVVHVGTVERWDVLNVTDEVHDFHIHQVHFLVESINGVKVTHPYWSDSFIVPQRTGSGTKSIPGSVGLLMNFRDPIIRGEFLFHCHILEHEDGGMMAKIEAVP